MRQKSYFLLLVLSALIFFASCQAHSDSNPVQPANTSAESPQELEKHSVTLATSPLQIMIARTEGEKRTGLMYRTLLADDEGMLFCYDAPQAMSFWMKNTKIPLDLVFFGPELTVTEFIKGMIPGYGVAEGQLPIYRSAGKAQYALELASGSVMRLGIRPGDKLAVPLPLLFTPTP